MTEELTQEILDWYAIRGKELSKMTDPSRMPPKVTRGQVEVAAVRFFHNIQHDDFKARVLTLKDGRTLKYIRIAWEIWEMAKAVDAEEYVEGQKKMLGATKIIQSMDDNHRRYAETAEGIIQGLNDEIEEASHRHKRERWALVAGLYCWLAWELYRAFGG